MGFELLLIQFLWMLFLCIFLGKFRILECAIESLGPILLFWTSVMYSLASTWVTFPSAVCKCPTESHMVSLWSLWIWVSLAVTPACCKEATYAVATWRWQNRVGVCLLRDHAVGGKRTHMAPAVLGSSSRAFSLDCCSLSGSGFFLIRRMVLLQSLPVLITVPGVSADSLLQGFWSSQFRILIIHFQLKFSVRWFPPFLSNISTFKEMEISFLTIPQEKSILHVAGRSEIILDLNKTWILNK